MGSVRGRWLSPRALVIHLAMATSVPLFLAAGWWQVHRAESGNTVSYAYAVEWPLFAGVAVYLWWQLLHLERGGRAGPPPSPAWPAGRGDDEGPELRRYNDELAVLAARGRPKTWRNPRGAP